MLSHYGCAHTISQESQIKLELRGMLTQIEGFDATASRHPRRKTYGVKVGHVRVGGGAPINLQADFSYPLRALIAESRIALPEGLPPMASGAPMSRPSLRHASSEHVSFGPGSSPVLRI